MALEPLVFKQLEQIDKKLTLPDSNAVDLEKYGIPQKFNKFVSDIVEIFKTLQEDSIENEKNRLEQLAKVVYTNHKQLLISTFSEKVSNETAKLYESLKELILKVSAEYILKKDNATQKIPEDVEKYVDQQLSVFFSALFSDLDELFTIASTNTTQPEPTKKQEKPKQKEQQNKSKSKKSKQKRQKQKETTDSSKNKEPVEISEPTNKSKNSDNKNNQKESDKKIEQKESAESAETVDQQSETDSTEQKNNKFISELQHIASKEEPEKINVLNEKNSKSLIINTLSRHAKPVSDRIKNVLYINTRRMLPDKVWWNKKLFRYKHDLTKRALNSTLATNIKKVVGAVKTSHYTLIAKKAITRINLKIQNVILKYVRPVLNNVWNRQTQQLFAPIVMVASGTLILVGGILQAAYSLGKYIFKVVIAGFKAGIKLLWNGIKALGGIIKKAFNVVSNLVTDTLKWIFRYPGMFLSGFLFKEICEWIKGNISGVIDLLKNNIVTNFLSKTVTKVYDFIKEKYNAFKLKHPKWGVVIDFLLGVGSWTFNFLGNIFKLIPNIFSGLKHINDIFFKPEKDIANAIKNNTVNELSSEQQDKATKFLNTHTAEEIEKMPQERIFGELVADKVKTTFDGIGVFFSNLKERISKSIAETVEKIQETDAYKTIEKFINENKDLLINAANLLEAYLITNTMGFTYPGAFAAIKATSPQMQNLILGVLIGSTVISKMFQFRDRNKFSMREHFFKILGYDNLNDAKDDFANAKTQYEQLLSKDKTKTPDDISKALSKYEKMYDNLMMEMLYTDTISNTIFTPDNIKKYNDGNIQLSDTLLDVINTITVNNRQYKIFDEFSIDFIKNLTDTTQKNNAIGGVFKARITAITDTIKNILKPDIAHKTVEQIISDKNYFQNIFGKLNNFKGQVIDSYANDKTAEYNRYIEYLKSRYSTVPKSLIPNIPEIKKPAANKPIKSSIGNVKEIIARIKNANPIKIVHNLSVNTPIQNNGSANAILQHRSIISSLNESNNMFLDLGANFSLNFGNDTDDFITLITNNFGVTGASADSGIAQFLMAYLKQSKLSRTKYDLAHFAKDNYIAYVIYKLADKNPGILKIIKEAENMAKDTNSMLVNNIPDENGNINYSVGDDSGLTYSQIAGYANSILDIIQKNDLLKKYILDECGLFGSVANLSNYLLADDKNKGWEQLYNAADLFTLGNPQILLNALGINNKSVFDELWKIYHTKITPETLTNQFLEDLRHNISGVFGTSAFKDDYDKNLDKVISTIQDLLKLNDSLSTQSKNTAENELNTYDSILYLFDTILNSIIPVVDGFKEEKELKEQNKKIEHEVKLNLPQNFLYTPSRNTLPTLNNTK